MTRLKLITLNIEGNKHWADIHPFIERENPDVLCLQEIFERDAAMLRDRYGYTVHLFPMALRPFREGASEVLDPWGVALVSRLPFLDARREHYFEANSELEALGVENKRGTSHQGVVWGVVLKDDTSFTIGTTKFTWTPDGLPNEFQDQDVLSFLRLTDRIGEMVACGDFNVPRGDANRIYRQLTGRFKDNIPLDVKTTVDVDKHYGAKDPVNRAKLGTLVVDYIFSTPAYTVSEVRLESGLSDHLAVIATISKI